MTPTSEHGVMPLAPIDRPSSWLLRALFALTRRRYGKTPMAFRVCYARAPWMALVGVLFTAISARFLRLAPDLRFLIPVAVAMRSGCTFCVDLTMAEAIRQRIGRARFAELLDFEGSRSFSEAEKAALAYVEAVDRSAHVEDAVLARLRRSFGEREVLEIVWLCAMERYYNSIALPLRIGSDHLVDEVRSTATTPLATHAE